MEENSSNNTNVRKCITAVIYDKMDKPYFLILKRKLRWNGWEFVKGGLEQGETEEDALKREILEETGLQKFKIIKKIEDIKKEFIGVNNKLNIHSIYLIEASMNIPIHLPNGRDAEHSTYLWAESDSAMSKLTWDNDKEILRKVLEEMK